jgi:hypothetical protein
VSSENHWGEPNILDFVSQHLNEDPGLNYGMGLLGTHDFDPLNADDLIIAEEYLEQKFRQN